MKNNPKIKKINHIISGIIIVLFLTSANFIMPTAISEFNQNPTITETIIFNQPTFNTLFINSTYYTSIEQEGCFAIGRSEGAPKLPIKSIKLLLPPQTKPTNIHIDGTPIEIDTSSLNLKQKPIIPYQNPTPIGTTTQSIIKTNYTLYTQNTNYPDDPLFTSSVGYSHGYSILGININTMQYRPLQGTLTYYPKMTITIDLEQTQEINQFYRNLNEDKSWVQRLVYNPEIATLYEPPKVPMDYPGGLCNPSDSYDYVIITTTHNDLDYWDTTSTIPYNWENLMNKHSIDDGLSSTLVTIQDITSCTDYHSSDPLFNDIEAHIREFCKDAYQDWETQYILIGGDDEWIPAREMDSSYENDIDSDLYWSNLDKNFNQDHDNQWGEEYDLGFDLYSELFIGRITCDEPKDVSNWMTKSFYYANNGDLDYLNNAGFYAGDMGWPTDGDDFIDFAAIKGTSDYLGPIPGEHGPYPSWLGFQYGFETWNNKNPTLPYDMDELWSAESPNPGWQGGSTNTAITGLRNAINNDKITLLSGVAHANADMSLDVYSNDWQNNYQNTKPFFIFDWGCHCGDMDAQDDGILHTMLFHSDTELAFACVYNTCYGWGSFYDTNSSSTLQMKSFWDYIFDTTNNSLSPAHWQLGKAMAFSKDTMAPTINWTYSSAPGSWRAVIEGCLLFADPAQKIKPPNQPPTIPEQPQGPDEGITNVIYTFTSQSTEPEGELIYYKYSWGDNTTSTWIGPFTSGEPASATNQWSEKGLYEIRVKARDENGGESPWSDPHPINILDGPILDLGQLKSKLIKVGVSIQNRGAAPAENVNWQITFNGGTILIGKESSGIIPSIPAGEEVEITTGFIFGFGKTQITAYAEIPEGSDIQTQAGNILLFLVIVKPGGG